MKNILIVITAMLIAFSCNSKSDNVVGAWAIQEVDLAGNKLPKELIQGGFIEFNADGTYSSNLLGEEPSSGKGTWQMNGEKIARKSTQGESWELTIVENTSKILKISYTDHEMQRILTFEKK